MSNLIKVPHTIVFEAIIETDLLTMCKEATVNAISESKFLQIANENNSWAEVTIKGDN
jgi:hypothetical protein